MPFTGFDQKRQLKSQIVKKKKKKRVKQFCPKSLLTLTGSSFHKVYHSKNEKEKNKKTAWEY